jgi:hypothetical protein
MNIDPQSPVPQANPNGDLVLNETKANYITEAFGAFLSLGAAIFSIMYWAIYYQRGIAPQIADKDLSSLAVLGFVALPFVPFLLTDLILPPRLVVSESGIALRRRGLTHKISWPELKEIKLQLQTTYTRRGSFSKTISYAFGRGRRLVWPPVFGVNPSLLADYVCTRGAREAGVNVAVTQGSGVSPFMRVQYAVLGIVLLIGVIGLLIIWLSLGVVEDNPTAIWIALHLPHLNADH